MTYTPPWKYKPTWRGSTRPTVISAAGTPPSTARVTVTSAGSGCADSNSRSSRRCSLTSLPGGKADCRRIASRGCCCSMLMVDLHSVGTDALGPHDLGSSLLTRIERHQSRRHAGEEASPDHGDLREERHERMLLLPHGGAQLVHRCFG